MRDIGVNSVNSRLKVTIENGIVFEKVCKTPL